MRAGDDRITKPGSFPQGSPLAYSVLLSLGMEMLQMRWMVVNENYKLNLLAVMLIFFPLAPGVGGYSRPT